MNKKLMLEIMTAVLLSLLLHSCGGNSPEPLKADLRVSTKFVENGQNYTVSWSSRNAERVTLKVWELSPAYLTAVDLGSSSPPMPRSLPSPITLSTGSSGSITETALPGITKMYGLQACQGPFNCIEKYTIVWEKQSILEAFASGSTLNPYGYRRWAPGTTVTICVQTTNSDVINAVRTTVSNTNKLLAPQLILNISEDPDICATTVTQNYIIVRTRNLGGTIDGATSITTNNEDYIIASEIEIDPNKMGDPEVLLATVHHEFAHSLGFLQHVNPAFTLWYDQEPYLMASMPVPRYDDLTTAFLKYLYLP